MTAGLPTERGDASPRAGDLARADVPTCSLEERLGEVADRTREAGFDTAIAVNEEKVVFGILRDRHLAKDADLMVEEAMSAGPSTFRPTVDPAELAELMIEHDLPNVPITTNGGVLVGLLLRADAARAALEAHRHHHHEEDHDG